MKGTLFSIMLLACVPAAVKAQVTVGPEAGLNFANLKAYSHDFADHKEKTKTGIRLGLVIDCKLLNNFSFQPGLFYVMNGSKLSWSETSGSHTSTYSETLALSALELPFNFQYGISVGKDNNIFLGAGPYIGYNISGKYTNTVGSGLEAGSMNIGNSDKDEFKSLDLGLGLNFGFRSVSGWLFRFRYQHGLVNEVPNPAPGAYIKQYSLGLQVGYLFGHKTKTPQIQQKK